MNKDFLFYMKIKNIFLDTIIFHTYGVHFKMVSFYYQTKIPTGF